jgi:hypothetical protein
MGSPNVAVWRYGLVRTSSDAALLLLDPDNGIEVRWKPIGRQGSSKYVASREVELLREVRCSLVIYHHSRGRKRDAFARRLVSELRERTRACFREAFRTPHVLFLLAAQSRHADQLWSAIELILERWMGQIEATRLASKPLHLISSASG